VHHARSSAMSAAWLAVVTGVATGLVACGGDAPPRAGAEAPHANVAFREVISTASNEGEPCLNPGETAPAFETRYSLFVANLGDAAADVGGLRFGVRTVTLGPLLDDLQNVTKSPLLRQQITSALLSKGKKASDTDIAAALAEAQKVLSAQTLNRVYRRGQYLIAPIDYDDYEFGPRHVLRRSRIYAPGTPLEVVHREAGPWPVPGGHEGPAVVVATVARDRRELPLRRLLKTPRSTVDAGSRAAIDTKGLDRFATGSRSRAVLEIIGSAGEGSNAGPLVLWYRGKGAVTRSGRVTCVGTGYSS